jgi:hypothetical protein
MSTVSESLAQLEVLVVRQGKVKHDEIAPSGRGLVQSLGAIRTQRHIVAGGFEIALNRVGRLALILDDKNCYSRSRPPLKRALNLSTSGRWPETHGVSIYCANGCEEVMKASVSDFFVLTGRAHT